MSFWGTNAMVRHGPCLEGGSDGDLQFMPFLAGDLGLVARLPYWEGVWGRDGGASIARRSGGGDTALYRRGGSSVLRVRRVRAMGFAGAKMAPTVLCS